MHHLKEIPKLSLEWEKFVYPSYHFLTQTWNFVIYKIITMKALKGFPPRAANKPISIAVSNTGDLTPREVLSLSLTTKGADRYGLLQRKSLLPEYLITLIIPSRSHRGLHSNANWSNTIASVYLSLSCSQNIPSKGCLYRRYLLLRRNLFAANW